jgi:hypothetical protein
LRGESGAGELCCVAKTEAEIIAEAVQAGVDIEMVEYNLTLTPEQRARQHDGALQLALELKRLGEEMRANAGATA